MKHYRNLSELHHANGWTSPENPLVSLIRCNQACSLGDRAFTSDFYMIGFKKLISGIFKYGRTKYDHDNGSMSFVKPRQIIEMRDLEFEEEGFLIFFHEDVLNGHPLYNEIDKYHYFEYETNEALHLSPKEKEVIWGLYDKIRTEYYNNQDEYSREIILGHISSILMYAQRFYKRQFINRTDLSGKTVTKFQRVISSYLTTGQLLIDGLPSVNQIADKLNMSPRYLTDMLKQETGKTAMELIHIAIIAEAKNLLTSADQSVAEIAYQLGFENVSYFTKLFKQQVGLRPFEFKKMNLN